MRGVAPELWWDPGQPLAPSVIHPTIELPLKPTEDCDKRHLVQGNLALDTLYRLREGIVRSPR